MQEKHTQQPHQSRYGAVHPTAKLMGTAIAVFAVLYVGYIWLSPSPEERAREEARDRQILVNAEGRGAELLQQKGDPRGWGPGVHHDAGPRPGDTPSSAHSNNVLPPTPSATPVSSAKALSPGSEPDPRTIFQPGQRFGTDELAKTIDKYFPKATFMPDQTVHVTSGGKSYVITARKVPAGSAIYEIVSVRER
jgi:hypothetical protein